MKIKLFIYKSAVWYMMFATFCISALSYLNSWNPSNQQASDINQLLLLIKNHCFSFIAFFFISSSIAGVLKQWVGNPNLLKAMEGMLDEYSSYMFDGKYAYDLDRYKHKVTLFQYQKWIRPDKWLMTMWKRWELLWPWTGWVQPIARSGHTNKNTNVYFIAHDNENYSEGVAGITFSKGALIDKLGLSDINTDRRLKLKYAQESFTPNWMVDNRIQKNLSLPLALLGVPIFSSTSEKWGVMVVDSIHADGFEVPKHDVLKTWQKSFQMLLKSHDL